MVRFVLGVLAALAFSHGAYAAPGAVDLTYNAGGSGPSYAVKVAAIDPQGRAIVFGGFNSYNGVTRPGLARLLPNGELDLSFFPGVSGGYSIRDVILLPDGKLLVGGRFGGGSQPVDLARLNSDGSVDESFNAQLQNFTEGIYMVRHLSNGQILIAGSIRLPGEATTRQMARLNEDGTPDLSFSVALNGGGSSIIILPDDRILISGSLQSLEDTDRSYILRLRRDGTLDRTFAKVEHSMSGSRLALQPDGKIIVANYGALRRLLPDGTPDPSWNVSSLAHAGAVALQADGKVVVAGTGVRRFNRDGSIDDSFDAGIPPNLVLDNVQVSSDGGILLGGTFTTFNEAARPYLVRLIGGDVAAPGAGVLTVAWPNQSIPETDGIVRIPVLRTGGNTGSVTVGYTFTAGTAGAGDFTAGSGTLSFAAGETWKWVEVSVLADTAVEGDEQFSLTLQNATGGATFGGATATLTIIDNDRPGQFDWRPLLRDQPEELNACTLKVSRVGDITGSVSVDFATVDGTAQAGVDFTATSGMLTFAAGENEKSISVPILNDALREGREAFTIELSNPTGGAMLRAEDTATVTIIDEDRPGAEIAAFDTQLNTDGQIKSVAELADGKLLVAGNFNTIRGESRRSLARLQADGTVDTTFNAQLRSDAWLTQIVLLPDGRFLGHGGRLAPTPTYSDLVRFNADGTLDNTFNKTVAGELIKILVQPDGRILVAGSFQNGTKKLVRLMADGALDSDFVAANYLGDIRDLALQPDGKILLANSAMTRLHPNGERDLDFKTSAMGGADSRAVVVQPDGKILFAGSLGGGRQLLRFLSDGSLDPDFDLGPPTSWSMEGYLLQLLPNGQILVNGLGSHGGRLVRRNPDGTVDSTFEVGINEYYGQDVLFQLKSGEILVTTIRYDNPPRLIKLLNGQLDDSGPSILEFPWATVGVSESAGAVTLTVTRQGGNTGAASVVYATSDGSAQSGTHYTSQAGTLNFAAGATAAQLVVPILGNTLVDGSRTFSVTLSAASGTTIGEAAACAVTIVDDERAGRLDLDAASYLFSEDDAGMVVKVRRTLGSEGEIGVTLTSIDGTAAADADFQAFSQVLTFAPGETEKLVSIVPVNDGLSEGDETFAIRLQNPTGFATLGAQANAASTLRDIHDPGSVDRTFVAPFDGAIFASVRQATGKVVVAGNFTTTSGYRSILRFNEDGTIDSSFAPEEIRGTVFSMTQQADGKLIIGGSFFAVNEEERNNVARLSIDGVLDDTFIPPPIGAPGKKVSSVGIQSDGMVVIGGDFDTVDGFAQPRLARLLTDGSFDPNFRPVVSSPIGTMLVQTDDKIVFSSSNNRVLRLLADGTVDSSFVSSIRYESSYSPLLTLALDSQGRLMVAGSFAAVDGLPRYNVARLLANGRVDSSFNAGTTFKHWSPSLFALQDDGRILIGGNSHGSVMSPIRIFEYGNVDESFKLVISNQSVPLSAMVILGKRGLLVTGQFTRIDDVNRDGETLLLLGPQTGTFRFDGWPVVNGSEGDEIVEVTVRRIGGTEGQATVHYQTEAGTALTEADFEHMSGTLTFLPGETAKTISIGIAEDTAYERTENFTVQLSDATTATLNPHTAALRVDLADNDSAKTGAAKFTLGEVVVSEGDQTATLEIQRVGGADESLTIDYACVAGSAQSGTDYEGSSGTVVFAHGVTSMSITVPLLDDWLEENTEEFSVKLTGELDGLDTAIVRIEDDDTKTLDTVKGVYSGFLVLDGEPNWQGQAKLTVAAKQAVSGTIMVGAERLTVRGKLDANGFVTLTIPRKNKTPAVVTLQLDITGASERFAGTVEIDGKVLDLSAAWQSFHATKNPAEAVGRYNVTFDHNGSRVPPGSGFGQLTVAKNGAVRAAGKLADGTSWSYSGPLAADGLFPVYVPLYSKKGLFQAEFVFEENGAWDCAGTGYWTRPEMPKDLRYPAPFAVALSIEGSAYVKMKYVPALGFAMGIVRLTGEGLGAPPDTEFSVTVANRFTFPDNPNEVALTVNATSGLLSGSFVHPANKKKMTLRGVVLPDESRAAGYFVMPGVGGRLEILPPEEEE